MNYTENYKGIKIDVQAPQVDLPEGLQAQIRKSIDKISRFTQISMLLIFILIFPEPGKLLKESLG
jgi:hypothetical protein